MNNMLCKMIGHKPTWVQRDEHSQGFICWRCGIQLGWDGLNGFSVLHDSSWRPLEISSDSLAKAHTQPLLKKGHWYSAVTPEEDGLSCSPIHPDDLPDWIKKIEKKKEKK